MIKDYNFWIIVVMELHNSPEARLIPHRAPQKDPTCPQHMWMLNLSTMQRGSLDEESSFCFTPRAENQESQSQLVALKFFMV